MRLAFASNISRLAIATGDAHLMPAVLAAQELGKPVTVAAFVGRMSAHLRSIANASIDLNSEHVAMVAA